MTLQLAQALPILLPKAIFWAQTQAELILSQGTKLDAPLSQIARQVGVQHPERIRLLEIHTAPQPEDQQLKHAVAALGLLGHSMLGLTLGYGVYIRQGHISTRLCSHEFRHVYQYEQAGSIEAFLSQYVQQVIELGYYHAPLEIDARAHELHH